MKAILDDKQELQNKLKHAYHRVERSEEEVEIASDDKARIAKECEHMIKEWRKKMTEYQSEMKKKDVVVETLNEQLKDAGIKIKNGDSKGLRIIQLENQLLQDKKKSQRDIGRLRVAHRNEMQSIDVQMSMLRREADQRAAAMKESESLKRDLSSYRNNVKLARFQSAEIRAATAVQETNGLKISLGETRHSLKRAKNKILKQSETIAR